MLVMLLNVDIESRLNNRLRNLYCTCILVFLLVLLVPYVTANWNPYEVIGVRRDATLNQIKKAYRELARKLHPDKSNLNEEEAGKRFIELNKAFNILKDPDRRSRFDHYGDIEENSRQSRAHQGYQRAQQTREYWTHGGHRTFTFFSSSNNQFRQKSISARQYYNDYLKESKTKLFFIFFYSDICRSCSVLESSWIKIIDELAKFNIGSFTINVYQESRLSQDLGVSSIPHIACLIDGQLKPYHYSQLSLSNIVKFTKSILPNNLVTFLQTESKQDSFIALGPQTNRLSAIIINKESNLKLRYLVLAFELRNYYKFGHVSTKLSDYAMLIKKYNLSVESNSPQTNLIAFNEDISKPINHIILDEQFDIVQLKKSLTKWPFLQLPKLFSQQRFDDLCLFAIPREGERVQIKLCVILFATDTPSSLGARNKLIDFIKLNQLMGDERVVFSYIDPTKQTKFMSSLFEETKTTYPPRSEVDYSIILIERSLQSRSKARYKWLKSCWGTKNPNEMDRAKLELHQFIVEYKSNSVVSLEKLALDPLVDEEGPNLAYKILMRFIDHIMRSVHFITSRESFSSMLILALCAMIASLFLYQTPHSPPLRDQPPFMPNDYNQPASAFNNFSPSERASNIENEELKIIELRAETYNGMIRLLKPGYRSIIVLITKDTRDILLPEFKKCVFPYRRNKTLLFGYLCLDKNLDWYRSLLQEATGVGDLNMNKRNCIGTVLSLNGFKKYFRVYHAKHRENKYAYDDNDETENEGSFLGFNDKAINDVEIANLKSEENLNNSSAGPLLVDNLLAGLPIWLDKMFDGLTKRYSLDSWPEDIN